MKYCSGILLKYFCYVHEVVHTNFSPIFEVFAIFDHNFTEIVATPNDRNKNCLAHLKKNGENRIKIDTILGQSMSPWNEQRTGRVKFHVNRCNESPLRGENADFQPVSKFCTGSLPLRGVLLVNIS